MPTRSPGPPRGGWQGRLLEWVGLGPIETPSRVVFSERGVSLHAYADSDHLGPVLVIVPAPIKRAYIWDLAPWASVVLRCVRNGLRVFLIEWTEPGAEEQRFGLVDYADRLIRDCLDAVELETGQRRACLAGPSIGGTLPASFARPLRRDCRVLVPRGSLHDRNAAGRNPIRDATPPGHANRQCRRPAQLDRSPQLRPALPCEGFEWRQEAALVRGG